MSSPITAGSGGPGAPGTPSPNHLSKTLDFTDLTAFGIAAILGEGGFNLISKGVATGGPLFPAALGGVAALFQGASRVYADAYEAFPSNTAESDVVHAEFGRGAAVTSAFSVIAFNVLSVSTILVFTAKNLLPKATWSQQISFSVALLAAMSGFALQGIQLNKQAILAFTAGIVALMLLASGVGLWESAASGLPGPMAYPHTLAKTPNLLKSVLYFYFILSGFDDVIKFVEEARDPDRDVPRSFYASNAIAALLVIGVAFAYLHVLTFKKDSTYHGENALALIVESAFGARAGRAVYWGGVGLMLATAFVSFLAVTRYMYGLADTVDGKEGMEGPGAAGAKDAAPSTLRRCLEWLRDLNASKAPWRSILFTGALAALAILVNHVDFLIAMSDLSLSVIMVLVSAAVTQRLWRKEGKLPAVEAATTAGFAGLLVASLFG
jgi:amino acid transporter